MHASDDMSPQERDTRIQLAACYRLVSHFGMSDLIYNHITARIPGTDDHLLINPYGMMFDEITASSLVKIDLNGNKLYPRGPQGCDVRAAYALHQRRGGIGAEGGVAAAVAIRVHCAAFVELSRLRRPGAESGRAAAPGARPGQQQLPDPAQPRLADGGPDDGRSVPGHASPGSCVHGAGAGAGGRW
ncbi:hypothetical protein G6F57_019868 [Rhizopus arrhizus]|nr:hypothetical protein G6F57_019868 [Rhizopus arrhizus]